MGERLIGHDENLDGAELQSESPTVEALLNNPDVTAVLLGDNTKTIDYDGRPWLGTSYAYEVFVPKPEGVSDNYPDSWFINVWLPGPTKDPRSSERPNAVVTILANREELPITSDKDKEKSIALRLRQLIETTPEQ